MGCARACTCVRVRVRVCSDVSKERVLAFIPFVFLRLSFSETV